MGMSKVVMLHIQIKGMEQRVPLKQLIFPYTHSQSPDGVKKIAVILHIKFKGMEHKSTMQAHNLS